MIAFVMSQSLPESILPENLEKYLLQRQREIEEQIKAIEVSDPLFSDSVAEASELGTDSWQADVHAKSVALKNHLSDLSSKFKQAMVNIKLGTYGKCDHCGENIDPQRMKAIPIATLCTVCVAS